MQNPEVHKPSKWAHVRRFFESLLVLGGLVGGGMWTGSYWTSQSIKADHLAEIERLQKANGVAMDYVLRVAAEATRNSATATANAAVATAGAAAATTAVSEVVGKVDAAAVKADKAAKKAAQVAAKPHPAPLPAAVQPEVVNREIRRANERLRESNK